MSESPRLRTTLNRKWVVKMAIFLVALFVLGAWGTADAFWIYPARGRHHIDSMLMNYLEELNKQGRLLADASVEDPLSEYQSLDRDTDAKAEPLRGARYRWLQSLSRLHSLRALTEENRVELDRRAASSDAVPADTKTLFANPNATLDRLKAELATKGQSKGLEAYDIPLQYLFMAIGFGGALYMIFFLLKCKGTVYEFDPEQRRLFMPGGKSFVPADIAEVDKREWHKYFLHLRVNGFDRELKFDLLRYAPLEDWLEEMRKLRPGYDPSEDAEDAPPAAEPPANAEKSADADAQETGGAGSAKA